MYEIRLALCSLKNIWLLMEADRAKNPRVFLLLLLLKHNIKYRDYKENTTIQFTWSCLRFAGCIF